MEYKWASFLQGQYALIKITNAKELLTLQKLAKKNKLFYYEWFCNQKYRQILNILDINAIDYHTFYSNTKGGKQFLVEYSYKGFTCAMLNEYGSDWEIIPMAEIIKELES